MQFRPSYDRMWGAQPFQIDETTAAPTGGRYSFQIKGAQIALTAMRGLAIQRWSTAEDPGSPAVCSQSEPAPSTRGTRT